MRLAKMRMSSDDFVDEREVAQPHVFAGVAGQENARHEGQERKGSMGADPGVSGVIVQTGFPYSS